MPDLLVTRSLVFCSIYYKPCWLCQSSQANITDPRESLGLAFRVITGTDPAGAGASTPQPMEEWRSLQAGLKAIGPGQWQGATHERLVYPPTLFRCPHQGQVASSQVCARQQI